MKTGLSILLFCICLGSFGQVPNTETFTLQNVASTISGAGAQARVDLVTKSSDPNNCEVSCNGYSHTMVWNVNPNITVIDFISDHSGDFGAVTLENYGYGQISFTANTPGVDFIAATIDGTGNTAINLVPNYSGSSISDLLSCYNSASTDKFDKNYYPNYSINGPNFQVSNSIVNFRNYGAVLRPPYSFVVRERELSALHLVWTDNSWDEDGFRIERSPNGTSNWTELVTTGPNIYHFWDTHLTPNTTYYYRIRSFNGGNYSAWVTTEGTTLLLQEDDWALPSLGELALMYQNLRAYNIGNFSSGIYWTSTETTDGTSQAMGISFAAPMTYIPLNKDVQCYVRAARHFNGTYNQYQLRDIGPRGGLIFYIVDFGGEHTYFEAYPQDQSASYHWSNVTNARVGTYTNINTSLFNTLNIISQAGHTSSAAKLCLDL